MIIVTLEEIDIDDGKGEGLSALLIIQPGLFDRGLGGTAIADARQSIGRGKSLQFMVRLASSF